MNLSDILLSLGGFGLGISLGIASLLAQAKEFCKVSDMTFGPPLPPGELPPIPVPSCIEGWGLGEAAIVFGFGLLGLFGELIVKTNLGRDAQR
jgi:hypothetical protein